MISLNSFFIMILLLDELICVAVRQF